MSRFCFDHLLGPALTSALWSNRVAALALALLSAAASPLAANPKSQQIGAPIEISGNYTIHFNGFNIGDVRIEQRIGPTSYVASSDVSISALLGAFHWKGMTRSSGTLAKTSVKPSGYDFRFSSSASAGSVRMNFDDAGVSELETAPQLPDPPDLVPLRRPHVKGVIDPLSALVSLSRPAADSPCGRKLALFDGKQRFDVALVMHRKERLSTGPDSAGAEAVSCRIRYTPIAGYRNNSDTRSLTETDGMEVTFRYVPLAGLWVAHRVGLPTMAGTVVIEAQRIDVSSAAGTEVAFAE